MKCNLIVELNELTVRDYTIVEDEGIIGLLGNRPEISFSYEDDEEIDGKHVLVLKAAKLKDMLRFLSFSEIRVKIIA